MKITGNTILITGGSSGIGLELAAELVKRANTVIVTGRDQSRLDAARAQVLGLNTIRSDVSDPSAVHDLYQKVITQYPNVNVLVNNAGIMRKINFHHASSDLNDITREIEINLNGTIWMTAQFLPHLKKQKTGAVVNVSSGLAFVPMAIAPIYCASKAALHSYTRSLRIQLKNTNITVFELAPPGTETPLFHGDFSEDDVSGVKTMPVKTLVEHALAGMEKGTPEIRPGLSNVLMIMSRVAPNFIFKQLNRPVDKMLAE